MRTRLVSSFARDHKQNRGTLLPSVV